MIHALKLLALALVFWAAVPVCAASGDVDTTFNPDLGITAVWTVTTQADGKVLVGCSFALLNPATQGRVCRLNADGTRDTAFFNNTGSGTDGQVVAIAVQSDGKILFGGNFLNANGASRQRLARLNSDGTLDITFQPVVDGPVNAIIVQPDGKIMVGGRFDHVNTEFRVGFARINNDGSLDNSFPLVGSGGCPSFFSVSPMALQTDGKVIGGGFFLMLNGVTCKNMARVIGGGTHDTAFDNNLGTGADKNVFALALASDGKIYAGGLFTTFNNVPRTAIARLNSDGTLDNTFAPTITASSGSAVVNTVVVQASGKILAGGSFAQVNSVARNNVVRLNADGTLDQTFLNSGLGPNGAVAAIALQTDGKFLVAGSFTHFHGVPRRGLVRLVGDSVVSTPSPTPNAPFLLGEENTNGAGALDSSTFVRGPVPVLNAFNFSSDQHTRVMLFADNVDLQPGEGASVITAQAEDSQQRVFPLTVEHARTVAGFDWLTQINVRLPDELANAGNIEISVRVRGVQSNKVLFTVKASP